MYESCHTYGCMALGDVQTHSEYRLFYRALLRKRPMMLRSVQTHSCWHTHTLWLYGSLGCARRAFGVCVWLNIAVTWLRYMSVAMRLFDKHSRRGTFCMMYCNCGTWLSVCVTWLNHIYDRYLKKEASCRMLKKSPKPTKVFICVYIKISHTTLSPKSSILNTKP